MAINFPEGQQDYPGLLHRVVSDTKTDTFTTSSTSFVTISGLSATISPRTTASKFLYLVIFLAGHKTHKAVLSS